MASKAMQVSNYSRIKSLGQGKKIELFSRLNMWGVCVCV